ISYDAFNHILQNTFGTISTGYTIYPQYPVGHESINFVTTFLIMAQASPVFFVEVKPPSDANSALKRYKADNQMRRRF
ncbi:hypothetical protein DEU56DRAFT_713209, partial [Suillus clintonianus]|uniref:uncharacterized protein n=1 Tax=Suillus clintonianus TaxID=1904413 RepID=UPI001B88547A